MVAIIFSPTVIVVPLNNHHKILVCCTVVHIKKIGNLSKGYIDNLETKICLHTLILFSTEILYVVIYFILRFDLANTIHTYVGSKIRVVRGEIFNLKCEFIEFVIPNLSLISEIYENRI